MYSINLSANLRVPQLGNTVSRQLSAEMLSMMNYQVNNKNTEVQEFRSSEVQENSALGTN